MIKVATICPFVIPVTHFVIPAKAGIQMQRTFHYYIQLLLFK